MTPKKNLVLVRAGDKSLHEGWLAPRHRRNWDLVVSYFGDDRRRFRSFRGEPIPRFDLKGPKYAPLHALLNSQALDWRRYDYLWLPDDDLATDCATINRMFDLCAANRLALAQPALTPGSYLSHMITWQHPAFRLRFTNFVEMMAPLFSRRFLAKCLPTFVALPGVASGVEFLWLRALTRTDRCAILDAAPVQHTRPVSGAQSELYSTLDGGVSSAQQQLDEVIQKYGVSLSFINRAGIDLAGRRLSLLKSDRFLGLLEQGLELHLSDPEQLAPFYVSNRPGCDASDFVVDILLYLLRHSDVRDGRPPRETLFQPWTPPADRLSRRRS